MLALGVVTFSLSFKKPSKPVLAVSAPPDMLPAHVNMVTTAKPNPRRDGAAARLKPVQSLCCGCRQRRLRPNRHQQE